MTSYQRPSCAYERDHNVTTSKTERVQASWMRTISSSGRPLAPRNPRIDVMTIAVNPSR